MKKHFLTILFILLAFLSCKKANLSNGEEAISSSPQNELLRSETEIRDIAMASISVFSNNAETKCSEKRISSIIPSAGTTKSEVVSPAFYVVNFDNEDGFVIVGARHDSPEVIVYSDKGNYDGKHSEIEAFNIYIDEIEGQLASASSDIDIPTPDYYQTLTRETSEDNNPLISVAWHQCQPFNWYCSSPFDNNVPAGCVAIAIAQIMSVYSSPASISLTYPNASNSTQTLEWTGMKQSSHYTAVHTNSCAACTQLATLLREIGNRVHMSYGVGGSGANSALYAKSALASFGYKSSDYKDYSLTSVMNSLDAKHPVYIRAGNSDNEGHAWVVDGSKYTCQEKTTYRVSKNSRTEVAREYVKNWYLHFNYGWGGSSDGYYIASTRKHGSGTIIVGGSYDDHPVSMFTGVEGVNRNVKIIPDICL